MESTGDGIDVSPVECSAVVTDGRGVDWLPQAVDPAEAAGRDTKGTFLGVNAPNRRVDSDILVD